MNIFRILRENAKAVFAFVLLSSFSAFEEKLGTVVVPGPCPGCPGSPGGPTLPTNPGGLPSGAINLSSFRTAIYDINSFSMNNAGSYSGDFGNEYYYFNLERTTLDNLYQLNNSFNIPNFDFDQFTHQLVAGIKVDATYNNQHQTLSRNFQHSYSFMIRMHCLFLTYILMKCIMQKLQLPFGLHTKMP